MHIYVGPALGGNPPNLWYPPRCGVGVGGGAVEAEVRIVVMIPVVLVLRSSNNGSKTTISSITVLPADHTIGGDRWHAKREHIYILRFLMVTLVS